MKKYLFALVAIAILSVPSFAFFGPKGDTVKEKKALVRKEHDEALAKLYKEEPGTKKKIQTAAGYAVFSNFGMHLFLISSGNGYGVLVDNKTGKETFMRMGSLGAGLGIGAKDFRAVFIFWDPKAMNRFAESGWEFRTEADVAAKAGETGAETSGAQAVSGSGRVMEIYQITETGVALQANLAGTKYWKDDDLNK